MRKTGYLAKSAFVKYFFTIESAKMAVFLNDLTNRYSPQVFILQAFIAVNIFLAQFLLIIK
jgi:hypothetical protein